MYFLKLSYKGVVIVLLSAIILLLLILLCRGRSYYDFDEKTWYEEYNDNVSDKMSADRPNFDVEEITKIRKFVSDTNKEQIIQHFSTYGPNFTLVIVIQVHDRAYYLEQILESLKQAIGIHKCLIILSHDYIDDEINNLMERIYFTKYIRIIYPYNVQIHPIAFPGPDLKYCPTNLIRCQENIRYRNPDMAQLKQHWWWTVSTVFDKLAVTRNYNGNVLFLEEDQYVAEDMVYVMKLVEKILPNHYPDYDMIALGTRFPRIKDYHINETTAAIEPWGYSENIAVAFNRTTWNVFKNLSNYFCTFNDYLWSSSLKFIATRTKKGKFLVLSIKSSRVFRFEKCQYSNDTFCHEVEKVIAVQKFVNMVKKSFYPQNLSYKIKNTKPKIRALGGWKDIRDRELCMFYTSKIRYTV